MEGESTRGNMISIKAHSLVVVIGRGGGLIIMMIRMLKNDKDDQKDNNKEEGMEIDLLRVGNKSEIRRILEMTVSDDKEREDREEYTQYH